MENRRRFGMRCYKMSGRSNLVEAFLNISPMWSATRVRTKSTLLRVFGLMEKRLDGGLNGSTQHFHEVYSQESESLRFFSGADLGESLTQCRISVLGRKRLLRGSRFLRKGA